MSFSIVPASWPSPVTSAVIAEGSMVVSRDNHDPPRSLRGAIGLPPPHTLGKVKELMVDTTNGKPLRLVVRTGHLLHEDEILPGASIASANTGQIYQNLDRMKPCTGRYR